MPRRYDSRLQLCLISDGRGDLGRIERVVREAFDAGLRTVQLREPSWSAAALHRACERLRPLVDAHDGWLLVNDRVDVAATGAAHGVQLGHRSLPWPLVRQVLGSHGVIGASCHDAAELAHAAQAGCDFALLSPVWPTFSKPGSQGLGCRQAGQLTVAAQLPVCWLGGVTADRVGEVPALPREQRPAGYAAIGALQHVPSVAVATASLLAAIAAVRAPRASE